MDKINFLRLFRIISNSDLKNKSKIIDSFIAGIGARFMSFTIEELKHIIVSIGQISLRPNDIMLEIINRMQGEPLEFENSYAFVF